MAAEESGNGFTRFAIRVPIQYRWNGDPHDRPAEGWTRDVSVRGARVELPALVPVGNALVVALGAGDGDSPLAAYVAWRQPGPAPYVHGLQFTGLTRTARARVGTLLDRVSPRAPRRLHCALPAMCRMHGVGMTGVPGVVRDLGIGGAGLRVPHTLPPATVVQLSIRTAFGPFAAEATVVWADPPVPRPRGATYRLGLRFHSLDAPSNVRLQALLEFVR